MHFYAFESYGVGIRIDSNRKQIIDRVRRIAEVSLLGGLTDIEPDKATQIFKILKEKDQLKLYLNGEDLADTSFPKAFYNYFESRLRVIVAEYAKDLVFVHAGVIGWKGKGILFPADSFQGKTTLVAALVRRGATYYSDDYAILDQNGLVHPFPRKLSIRDPKREFSRSNVAAKSLGGLTGDVPLPVSAVILTRFRKDGNWKPKILSSARGIMQIIPQAIPVRANTELTLKVLKTVANRAIIAKSLRGDTKFCLDEIICFLEKF